jgi:hypothetical protein
MSNIGKRECGMQLNNYIKNPSHPKIARHSDMLESRFYSKRAILILFQNLLFLIKKPNMTVRRIAAPFWLLFGTYRKGLRTNKLEKD